MNLLAIDCSTPIARLGLATDKAYYARTIEKTLRHTECVLPVLKELLEEAQLTLAEIKGIIYAAGPGSFTGVRIAVALAQALSLAENIPTLGLSTLNILAQGAYRVHQWPEVAVGIDARMGEVYWGIYQQDAALEMMCSVVPDSLSAPECLELPSQGLWRGVGDARGVYEERFTSALLALLWDTNIFLDPLDMITLAKAKIRKGELLNTLPLPIYLRNEVAHKKRK